MRGFSLIEVVVALALMSSMFLVVVTTQIQGGQKLVDWISEEKAYRDADVALRRARIQLESNYSNTISNPHITSEDTGSLFKTLTATIPWHGMMGTSSVSLSEDVYDWRHAEGGDTCNVLNTTHSWKLATMFSLPSNPHILGIDILNGLVYVSVDPASISDSDLYIVDIHNPQNPFIVSSLDTGTGGVVPHAIPGFVFLAEQSARYPFRVLNTSDISHPYLQYEYMSTTSSNVTGYGAGNALYYYDHRLYFGTVKSVQPELLVFDTTHPESPVLIGSYETGSAIQSIVVKDTYAYLATAGDKEILVLDISDISHVREISSITPSGYGVQDGKTLFIVGSTLYIGRTVGGFDNASNHELFAYNISTPANPILKWSMNIGSSVNKVIVNRRQILAGIGKGTSVFNAYSLSATSGIPSLLKSFSYGVSVIVDIDCEDATVVVGTENPSRLFIYTQNP